MSPKRRREQQADKAEKADAPAATDTVTATDGEEGGEQQA